MEQGHGQLIVGILGVLAVVVAACGFWVASSGDPGAERTRPASEAPIAPVTRTESPLVADPPVDSGSEEDPVDSLTAPNSTAEPDEAAGRSELDVPAPEWFPQSEDPHPLWPEFEERYADATIPEMMEARDHVDGQWIRALEEFQRERDELLQVYLTIPEANARADRSKADALKAEYSWINEALRNRSVIWNEARERAEAASNADG